MDCQHAQEEILESCLAEMSRGVSGFSRTVEVHLSGCAECARFAASQQAVDARLAGALVSPSMTSTFRSDLRKKIRQDARSPWPDRLPDIVHFASCGLATAGCALLLPFDAATTVGAGATAALLTYILLTAVRSSFEDIEQRDGH
jgi:anti-sigma factor RsiW